MKIITIPALASAVIACLMAVVGGGALARDKGDFVSYWHDGKAEIDTYEIEVSRYGEPRRGQCVMIFVTEPFSDSKRVKLDDPSRNPEDKVDVLKLNLVRDFQTGIYDYNTMISVFSRTADFAPVKISFSSAEWCGHVYEEMRIDPERITGHYYSYFEGESGPLDLERPDGGLIEDNLFIRLRGLRKDFLEPGERKVFPFLPGTFHGRLSHQPPVWTTIGIVRKGEPERVEVPAGEFTAIVYELEIAGGRRGTFHIDANYPHRILRWTLAPDIRAELMGTTRTQYWSQNGNDDEHFLRALGLEPIVK